MSVWLPVWTRSIEQMFHWNIAASAPPFMGSNQLINSFLHPSWLIRRNSSISLISQLRKIQEKVIHVCPTLELIEEYYVRPEARNRIALISFCGVKLWWRDRVHVLYIFLYICILWHRSSVTRCLYYNIVIYKHIILWIIHQCFSLSAKLDHDWQ